MHIVSGYVCTYGDVIHPLLLQCACASWVWRCARVQPTLCMGDSWHRRSMHTNHLLFWTVVLEDTRSDIHTVLVKTVHSIPKSSMKRECNDTHPQWHLMLAEYNENWWCKIMMTAYRCKNKMTIRSWHLWSENEKHLWHAVPRESIHYVQSSWVKDVVH